MPGELGSEALRELREQIARESNPERLRGLVININALLNLIEDQVAKLEGRLPPSRH
jgi:hypothetical protein